MLPEFSTSLLPSPTQGTRRCPPPLSTKWQHTEVTTRYTLKRSRQPDQPHKGAPGELGKKPLDEATFPRAPSSRVGNPDTLCPEHPPRALLSSGVAEHTPFPSKQQSKRGRFPAKFAHRARRCTPFTLP